MDIHGFLQLPHRFRWGGVGGEDCMTFSASWVLHAQGFDPVEDLRGTYRTKEEAHSLVAVHGGFVGMAEAHLLPHGFQRVSEALDGDVGIVRMMAGETYENAAMTEVGAIRFGPLWASIGPGGVRATKAEMIAAWRMPT
jgi:hypothetical protein